MIALAPRSALAPWRPGPGDSWDRSAALHLLFRAGFGPRRGELERALDEGPERTLERLGEAPADLDRNLDGIRSLLGVGRIEHLQAWWLSLLVGGGIPLVERATLLWHDHFATSFDKVGDVTLMHRQNALLRAGALGDFRALLRGVAKDPAMLVWLDGDENRRGRPNENFAREVMELFALGIGNYGERDVREAARAFTGWGTRGRAFAFTPEHHDAGSKVLFGVAGTLDGDAALERILAHPACPAHVARRLLAGFVGPNAGADAERELAALLEDRGWEIGAALDVLLRSRLFFDRAFRRGRIAAPVELVAIAARALDLDVPPVHLARAAERMGQGLFRPPSVEGWHGGRDWIDAGTWLARHNELAAFVLDEHGSPRPELAERFGPLREPREAADGVLDALLPDGAPAEIVRILRETAEAAGSVSDALARTAALLLSAPELHRV